MIVHVSLYILLKMIVLAAISLTETGGFNVEVPN